MWQSVAWKVLSQLMPVIIGAVDWKRIIEVVTALSNQDITGDEKRATAIDVLREQRLSVGKSLLNFAIEAAVQLVRSKAQ